MLTLAHFIFLNTQLTTHTLNAWYIMPHFALHDFRATYYAIQGKLISVQVSGSHPKWYYLQMGFRLT